MNKKKVFTLMLCILALTAVLAGCGNNESQNTEPQTEPATVETEPAATATEETFRDPNVVVISTPYGSLYYQEQWVEFMKVIQTTEGAKLTVSFAAEINGIDYALFRLDIGEGEGDPVGVLTDADGVQRDVYLTVEENMEHAELNQDEQNRLYAMQEELNYVMQNLK